MKESYLSEGVLRELYNKISQNYFNDCKRWIPQHSKILDVGCGSGLIANEFRKRFNSDVVGIDVKDFRIVPIKFVRFNGEKIPFKNRYFDATLLLFVLHHTLRQEILLREIKRVTKRYVIIYEDVVNSFFDKILSLIHIKLFSFMYDVKGKSLFRNQSEWERIFKNLGFRIIKRKCITRSSDFWYPIKRVYFVLGVN